MAFAPGLFFYMGLVICLFCCLGHAANTFYSMGLVIDFCHLGLATSLFAIQALLLDSSYYLDLLLALFFLALRQTFSTILALLSVLNWKDSVRTPMEKRQEKIISVYIPIANSYTPECAISVTKLPFCSAKLLSNHVSLTTVIFLEFRLVKFGPSSQKSEVALHDQLIILQC